MAARKVADIRPSQTIYVNNLNEKLKKEALKRALFAVFSQFGRILDIVALKTLKLRGQAWIVFADVSAASNALRQMQSFPFYGKPMRIQYAKTKSDVVARRDGTYVPRDKRKRLEESEEAAGRAPKRGATATAMADTPMTAVADAAPAAAPVAAPPPAVQNALPNKILYAWQLPAEATQDVLRALFEQYGGFKEVRSAAGTGIAFIEFENQMQATSALQALNNFNLSPTHRLQLAYAKQ